MTAPPTKGAATPASREGRLPPTPREEMDRAVEALAARRRDWVEVDVTGRIELLERLIADFAEVAERWVDACLEAERIPPANAAAGEEWIAGPYLILRNLRLLETALEQIAESGTPEIPGGTSTRDDGQVVAHVFPGRLYDRIFYPPGMTAEVWMEPGVSEGELGDTQALAYRRPDAGGVALVLGAGNVSSIGPMDALYKLFVENRVVLFKVHPVNDYLGPLMAEGLSELVERGFLRLAYGGAEQGAYLCAHDGIDEIHITGSDKTVEAIVFGPGEEGARRKAQRRPRLTKPISSELGNVSPVIVVPGPWSAADLAWHAESLVSMLVNNAGFNCNAARVIVQHESWQHREALLDAVRRVLASTPTRHAYYPGAEERHERFVESHPRRSESFGDKRLGHLPWTLVPYLDPEDDEEICYRQEAFAGVFAETAIAAGEVADYVARAVELANERLWGTLSATLVVHPKSLADPEVAEAVERAVADLRYGTVTVNQWAAIGYGLVVTPWGAYPGHDVYDIQSGSGVVHNTLMFSRAQKAVVRVPFRVWPKPPWFASHSTAAELGRKLTEFEADPSPARLPSILWSALRG